MSVGHFKIGRRPHLGKLERGIALRQQPADTSDFDDLSDALDDFEDGNLSPKEDRQVAFRQIYEALDPRLAEGPTPHLHTHRIEFLALAIEGAQG